MVTAKYMLQVRSGDRLVAELPVNGVAVSFQLVPIECHDSFAPLAADITQNTLIKTYDQPESTEDILTQAKKDAGVSVEQTPVAPVRQKEPVLGVMMPEEEKTLRIPKPTLFETDLVDELTSVEDGPTEESGVSLAWEMDEYDPLDERAVPALVCDLDDVRDHALRPERTLWTAWAVGFLAMAAVAACVSLFLGAPTAMEEVSSEMVRVTYPPPKPIEKPEVKKTKPRKKKPRKSKSKRSQPASSPAVAANPSAEAQMDEAVAALKLLQDMPTTNLNVVSSPSRGGTKTAGVVVKLKDGERVRTGVGQIGVNTDAVAATDKNSKVNASAVGRQGRVSRPKSRDIAVDGTLSKDAIQAVVNRHLGQIRGCYERNLLKNPTMKGKIVVRWRIQSDGRAAGVSTAVDSLGDAATTSCVLASVRSWRFPSPKGGSVRVSYPFNFSSTGA